MPASPARAASTAAFRARILVWNAISSTTLMIFEILLLESLIVFIDLIIRARVLSPSVTRWSTVVINWATWLVLAAFCRVIEVISSAEADVDRKSVVKGKSGQIG